MATSRYLPAGAEAEFEPGSRGRVLRNSLGIRLVRDIKLAESQRLGIAQTQAIDLFSDTHRFTQVDVCNLHRLWLAPVYPWAGEFRGVNLGKGGFQFAAAAQVPRLMAEFERDVLGRLTPCLPARQPDVANALAIVHAELILIHPFREGNGRLARLLALLMGLQAGLPPLNFSSLDGNGKQRYIAAIHAAVARDYQPLSEIFLRAIKQTWKTHSSSSR